MNKEYLEKNIFGLPKNIIEAVSLYYIDKISTKEIAEKLNISASTARSRISKGLYQLKKKMNDKELMEAHSLIYQRAEMDRKEN